MLLPDEAQYPQRRFFDGHVSEAEAAASRDEQEANAIVHCFIRLVQYKTPERVYLVNDPYWRRLFIGAHNVLVFGDDSQLHVEFPLQRQREIASLYRAIAAWKRHEPMPIVFSSDDWSEGRKLQTKAFFYEPKERCKIAYAAYRKLIGVSMYEAAKSLQTFVALSQETATLMNEARDAFEQFRFTSDMEQQEWGSARHYGLMQFCLGDIHAARRAITRASMLNVNLLLTHVDLANFAERIGETLWAGDQIDKALSIYASSEPTEDDPYCALTILLSRRNPDLAETIFVNGVPCDNDNKAQVRDNANVYMRQFAFGTILESKGQLDEAALVYEEAFRGLERLNFLYHCILVANRLQEVSHDKQWRQRAIGLAEQYGAGILRIVERTMPCMNETNRKITDELLRGAKLNEIAAILNLSHGYVRNSATAIYRMLGVKGQSQLITLLES